MRMSKKKEIVPKFRFPEFQRDGIDFVHGNNLFKSITNKNHNSDLPILAITQDQGAVPRDQIEYNVTVTDKSLSNYKVVEVGDFIISLRSFQGGIEYSRFKGICSPAYIILRKREENISELYYKYFFKTWRCIQSLNRNLEGIRDGKMISYSQFSSVKVPYPRSFKEQQKIADCLSSIDELIDAENRKLKALEKYKKGLMQKLFPAEGKTLPEWRFPEFKDCEEWETVKLEKLALYRRGSFPQPYGLPEWYDEKSGMPFIQVFDVDDNMKLKSNTKNKISELAAQQSVFIPKGTLIITIQGSIGRVAITQYDAYIDRTLLLFEKFFRKIDKTFLAYNLQLLFDIEKQKAPGGIIKTITKQALSEFLTSIPRIEEQEKIAGCLSEVDTMITEQSNKVEQLKAHKKGLMQGLFPPLEEADV